MAPIKEVERNMNDFVFYEPLPSSFLKPSERPQLTLFCECVQCMCRRSYIRARGLYGNRCCHYIGSFRHNQVVKFYESSAIKANRQHFRDELQVASQRELDSIFYVITRLARHFFHFLPMTQTSKKFGSTIAIVEGESRELS